MYKQIGIASHANNPKICEKDYADKVVLMYTRVDTFIYFIVPIVWPDY